MGDVHNGNEVHLGVDGITTRLPDVIFVGCLITQHVVDFYASYHVLFLSVFEGYCKFGGSVVCLAKIILILGDSVVLDCLLLQMAEQPLLLSLAAPLTIDLNSFVD